MDDTFVVGARQAPRDLTAELGRLPRSDRTLVEPFAERLALEQLRDDERGAVHGPEVVDLEDVRVRERRDRLGLALEPREVHRVVRHLARKDLDGDLAVELGIDRPPDLSHAALTDLLDDAVVQQLPSGLERHEPPPPNSRHFRPHGRFPTPRTGAAFEETRFTLILNDLPNCAPVLVLRPN